MRQRIEPSRNTLWDIAWVKASIHTAAPSGNGSALSSTAHSATKAQPSPPGSGAGCGLRAGNHDGGWVQLGQAGQSATLPALAYGHKQGNHAGQDVAGSTVRPGRSSSTHAQLNGWFAPATVTPCGR